MDMDFEDGVEQIIIAYRKDAEDILYKQWLVDYGNMDEENYMSFEKYIDKAFSDPTKLDKIEILSEAEKIKNADQGRR